MPQIRVSTETKEELDRLGKRLLRLAAEEGAPVRVSRHQAGDFVSADETIAWALRSLDGDMITEDSLRAEIKKLRTDLAEAK